MAISNMFADGTDHIHDAHGIIERIVNICNSHASE